ncbi:MAG: hypothetical protein M3Y51_10175 [Actinomycetota bacterium]|nr:hypothetical protein [Actinomycetota bacterium]
MDDIGGKPPLGALFSTAASDNAEVVPPTAPRGPESMWSTDAPASAPGSDEGDAPTVSRNGSRFSTGTEEPVGGWEFTDRPEDRVHTLWDRAEIVEEGPFSAEPVGHDDDVIDAGDVFDPIHDDASAWNPPGGTGSVFSSGPPPSSPPPRSTRGDDSPWTVLADEWDDDTTADPDERAHRSNGSRRRDVPPADASTRWADHTPDDHPAGEPISDPHGLEAAVGRLSVHDQERAAVAIAVCGALLEPDELVAVVVTGQMLGRPAAVAVTDRRVIIANDRRWQPLVDVYRIDSKLVVRGRHDRQVAALSFADMTRLSMIDGITEVELAIELAERIRDSEPPD